MFVGYSGMFKFLCPDKTFEEQDITIAMKMAVESRQRVNALLSLISPEEFDKDKETKFSLG